MQLESLSGDAAFLLAQLDPARTAVVGIHWQRGVVSADSSFGSVFAPLVAAAGVLPRVVNVIQAVREHGGTVAHVHICNPAEIRVNNPLFLHAQHTGALRCGSPEVQAIDEIEVQPGDIAVTHHRVSAFADTRLGDELSARNVDTLVVTGVATNVAVEGTVRDAVDQGFFTIVLADCCVAGSQERHDASLRTLEVLSTAVMKADDFTQLLRERSGVA